MADSPRTPTLPSDSLVPLESVLRTEELARRPIRPPDYENENRALVALAQALADSPRTVLQQLADTILDVLRADSAGLSLLTKDGTRFHWPAIAGIWQPHIGGGTPREFGPCGDVLDRDAPLLFTHFERRYTYFLPVTPPVEECLLVPFHVHGKAVGTIWAIAHDERRKFDAEDLRILVSLGRFASSVYQTVAFVEAVDQRDAVLQRRQYDLSQRVSTLQTAKVEVDDARRAALNLMEDAVQSRQAAQALNAELRASEKRYRTLFECIDEGFCIIEKVAGDAGDPLDFRYLEANPAFAEQTGVSDVVGKTIRQAFPGESEEWFATYDNVVSTGEPIRFERGLVTQGRVLELYAFRVDDDTHRRVAVIFKDITERKQYEEALSESDRHKSEFLAMLAHELRNPLAPILVSIEILRRMQKPDGTTGSLQLGTDRPDTPDDVRRVGHALDVLRRQVGQMVRLVDDLLDAGRISRGKIELRRERVELSSIIHHVLEAVRPISERRDLELTITLPTVPVYVNADPTRLAQVVGNLLNNACKFTDRGGHLWLSVEREEQPGDDRERAPRRAHPQIAIRVRDTGIGIAADQLEHVFEMFAQIDTSLERSSTGLGIGLTLVKTLTEMHGGTVGVSSAGLGRGSEFVVRLPIEVEANVAAPVAAPGDPVPTQPLRILIVDDNRDSADMLAMLLKFTGHETFTAHDGAAAVEGAARLDPDVILLDIGLPGLNGYEAARRIRQQQRDGNRPVLIALTGWGQDEDRRRSEEAGFDAHVVKPVDEVFLGKLLGRLTTKPRGGAASNAGPRHRTKSV
jgi:PAS domain S-box-containing protein